MKDMGVCTSVWSPILVLHWSPCISLSPSLTPYVNSNGVLLHKNVISRSKFIHTTMALRIDPSRVRVEYITAVVMADLCNTWKFYRRHCLYPKFNLFISIQYLARSVAT